MSRRAECNVCHVARELTLIPPITETQNGNVSEVGPLWALACPDGHGSVGAYSEWGPDFASKLLEVVPMATVQQRLFRSTVFRCPRCRTRQPFEKSVPSDFRATVLLPKVGKDKEGVPVRLSGLSVTCSQCHETALANDGDWPFEQLVDSFLKADFDLR